MGEAGSEVLDHSPVLTKIGIGDVRISDAAKANVQNALDSNRLSYGPWTRQFEQRFALAHDRDFAFFVNSGTDALRIGLAAMKEKYGWKDGDGVLVPGLTFVASVNVIFQNNLTPVLIDIDPDYYDMADEHQRYSVVAAMPVSLFGQPTAYRPVAGLRVIEDSCESMFVGRSRADVTCYSTYACHILNTGVGGLATTDDPALATLIRSLANHGRDGIYTSIDQDLGKKETIAARFNFERMGYSARLTELEAAIGCAELDTLEENILSRQINANVLTNALSDLPLVLPKIREGGQHAFMMFPVRAESKIVRDALVWHLENQGIETRPLMPITSQPVYKAIWGQDLEDRFPVAKMVNETGFYIGCHQHLSTNDLIRIVAAFHDFFEVG